MIKSDYIKKLNELDAPPKNRYDKGGTHLIGMMNYYRVNGLKDLSLEQVKKYYEKVKGN